VSASFRVGAQALSVALVVGLLALLVWKVAHQLGNATVASQVRKGKEPAVPAFELPRLGGGTLVSNSLTGKAQVVNFWASWCIPCREEAPLLENASHRYGDRLVVLGVDHQDFSGDARGFVRRYDLTYPSVVDKGDKLYTKYGLTGVPETFCANRRGRVVAHIPGAVTRETLDQCIRDALSS
jgi:cytochrome c biogenesis protein CcmG, thiol:disulfide interchange protein DsbE